MDRPLRDVDPIFQGNFVLVLPEDASSYGDSTYSIPER